ncbi:hypothetical protein SAMN05518672_103360 [Chitinophaga sp. CF118]|nr:hypothetical protein SAMN05518672_103360 [Chitinophaga sp. CF118]
MIIKDNSFNFFFNKLFFFFLRDFVNALEVSQLYLLSVDHIRVYKAIFWQSVEVLSQR